MSQQQCAVKDCKRASRTLCQCCNQNLCRDHFNQHAVLLNSQLNPLTDQINSLSDRLSAIRIDRLTSASRKKLDGWRLECHRRIDQFYEQKCVELECLTRESIDEQGQEIIKIHSKVIELIEKQETTKNTIESLATTIRRLEQKMNDLENIHVHVDVQPIEIDNSYVKIGKKEEKTVVDLARLSAPYHTFDRSCLSRNALASNDRVVLTHTFPNLCLLDKNLQRILEQEYTYKINDMCWSSALEQFIFTGENGVYLFNEDEKLIKEMKEMEKDRWYACGCSGRSLFLSHKAWDSSVWEFALLPSIRFVKQRKTDDGMEQDLRIDAINCSSEIVVLAINNRSTRQKLVQIRSLETFAILRSVTLNVEYNENIIRCCKLNDNEWLFSDWSTSRVFHISKEGEILGTCTYPTVPSYVNVFRSETLVVLTDGKINFHKLTV